jgi:Xaa-Pro dipeptidase
LPPHNHANRRSEMIRSFLQQHKLQAWIAWRPDELVMMSGYLPFWGASVLLFLEQEPPILFVPVLEPRDHLPAGITVREYPWGALDCADPYAVLADSIRDELERRHVDSSGAGMLRGSARSALPIQAGEQIPLPELFWETFSAIAAQPDAEIEKAFLGLYLHKTPREIEAIRLANQIAALGIKIFHDQLAPGVREIDVASAVETTIQKQVGQAGIFHARAWAMVQSGPNSADAGQFNRSTARALQNGDLVVLELATCVNGYWSDLTRTAPVGQLEPELAKIFSTVSRAQRVAIEAIRPGVSAGDIDASARDIIASEGWSGYFNHATGHHVGFRYHDPGFGICPGVTAKLEPGMIITVEPGAYVHASGGGARMEDNVLVTETGSEVLSKMAHRADA